MDQTSLNIIFYIAGLLFAIFLAKIFSKPFKIILRLLLSSALGCLCIVAVNTFSLYHGISIGINPITATVCGVLGLPGVALLALVKIIL